VRWTKDEGTDRSFHNFRSDSPRSRGAFFAQRKKRVSTSVLRAYILFSFYFFPVCGYARITRNCRFRSLFRSYLKKPPQRRSLSSLKTLRVQYYINIYCESLTWRTMESWIFDGKAKKRNTYLNDKSDLYR